MPSVHPIDPAADQPGARFAAQFRGDTPWVDISLPSHAGKLTLRLPELISDLDRRLVYSEDNLRGIAWRRLSDGAISSHWRREDLAAYRLSLTAVDDGLAIDWTITNLESRGWPSALGNVCMQSQGVPDLHDPVGDRTFVHANGRWLTVASTRPAPGGIWYFPLGLGPLNIMVPHLRDGSWRVSDCHLDAAIAAVVSGDGQWILAQAWHQTRYVVVNIRDGYACTDVAPDFGDIAAGESFRVRGKIYVLCGGLDHLEERYRADVRQGAIGFRRLAPLSVEVP